jgi:hypothetical protein
VYARSVEGGRLRVWMSRRVWCAAFFTLTVGVGLVAAGPVGAAKVADRQSSRSATESGTTVSGVACVGPTTCAAVGTLTASSGGAYPIVYLRRGSSWTPETLSIPSGDTSASLHAVACITADSCLAVGNQFDGAIELPLVEKFDGLTWTASTPPLATTEATGSLDAISCGSARLCVAGGAERTGSNRAALIETWNGSRWSAALGATSVNVIGAACPSSAWCTLIGAEPDTGGLQRILGVVEVPSEGSWAAQPLPGFQDGGILGVSCLAVDSCIAVGQSEGWGSIWKNSGSKWPLDDNVSARGQEPIFLRFSSISCPRPSWCLLVGITGTNLAGSWHGGERPAEFTRSGGSAPGSAHWRESFLPKSASKPLREPTSVSCSQEGACTVVATVEGGSGAVAYELANSRWSYVALPAPNAP